MNTLKKIMVLTSTIVLSSTLSAGLFKKALVYPKDTPTSFEIQNKGDSIFIALTSNGQQYTENGRSVFNISKGSTKQFSPDIAKATVLNVWTRQPASATDQPLKAFEFTKDKTIYLTWDQKGFPRPQTGLARGVLRKTNTNLSLKNNVSKKDIMPVKILTEEEQAYEALGLKGVQQPTAYQILGVKAGASMPEIKKSWFNLMRKWHPDKAENKALAQKVSKVLNNAYDKLKK